MTNKEAEDFMKRHGITDEMLDEWAAPFEKGDYPHSDEPVHYGAPVFGQPPDGAGEKATLSVRLPVGLKDLVVRQAKEQGITTNYYACCLIAHGALSTLYDELYGDSDAEE